MDRHRIFFITLFIDFLRSLERNLSLELLQPFAILKRPLKQGLCTTSSYMKSKPRIPELLPLSTWSYARRHDFHHHRHKPASAAIDATAAVDIRRRVGGASESPSSSSLFPPSSSRLSSTTQAATAANPDVAAAAELTTPIRTKSRSSSRSCLRQNASSSLDDGKTHMKTLSKSISTARNLAFHDKDFLTSLGVSISRFDQ